MANYATHIAAGTVVSGALATLTMAADVIGPQSLIAVTLAGVVGSVLPDIDLKDSRAGGILFSGIGVFASFCVLFLCAPHTSIAELWILWLGTLVLVRYGLHALFHRFAVHRGIWHSVLAGLFFACLTVLVFKAVLRLDDGVAWLGGAFMLVGYLVHLVLDEVYAVDFLGNRIKSSFGTALKLYDGARPATSGALFGATVALVMLLPSPKAFIDGIGSRDLWVGINERLLPRDTWFGGLADRSMPGPRAEASGTSAPTAQGYDIVTGSILAPSR
jgi:hypothetical protein